jgi:PAS domain S-box-containing protein
MADAVADGTGLRLERVHGVSMDVAHVAGDAPAAVLLVDLRERAVVYANPLAEQLAPNTWLPVGVEAWSDAAQLRDLDGTELADTDHPLTRVARSEPVAGQLVSAARASDLGGQREPMWVVGLPMSGAPQLEDHALVVFLPLRARAAAEAAATAARAQADLRDRAVLATGMSFTVVDARAEDMPLIWVNPAFTATTGYPFEEAVGRNCRFLQGPATDPAAPARMRTALEAGEDVTVTVLNYRRDGTSFWNQVAISPIHGPDGELTHFVGIQTDVTARVMADEERDQAHAAECSAREEAERAHTQLALLAEATIQLAGTLDVRESLHRLASIAVPVLADWTLVVTSDRHGAIEEVVAGHPDGDTPALRYFADQLRQRLTPRSPFHDLFAGRPAWRMDGYDSPENRLHRAEWVDDSSLLDRSEQLGARSVMFVPLPGRRHVIGGMVLARGHGSPAYTEQDLAVATDLGRRAGLTLDNARLYQSEHHIAETLQRSLLPELPRVPGLQLAARYRASESGADVGGDFYEVITLPDGALGVAVGDVVGHDVFAAAAMGHLRGLLRASVWDVGPYPGGTDRRQGQDPAVVLTRVDRLVQGLEAATLASLVYARLEPLADQGGKWRLRYSSAGHPPMLVRRADGTVDVLGGADGLLLGVAETQRRSAEEVLEPGSTLLGYTDGLVERRGESLDAGLNRLCMVLRTAPGDVDALVDHVVDRLGDSDDDVAVLALRL